MYYFCVRCDYWCAKLYVRVSWIEHSFCMFEVKSVCYVLFCLQFGKKNKNVSFIVTWNLCFWMTYFFHQSCTSKLGWVTIHPHFNLQWKISENVLLFLAVEKSWDKTSYGKNVFRNSFLFVFCYLQNCGFKIIFFQIRNWRTKIDILSKKKQRVARI